MSVENGEWIMHGLDWDDPFRIRTCQELVNWINEIGFLPLFGNEVAGFISLKWLPYFVNSRRSGYDFDARWEDGLASRREKKIMDFYIGEDDDGDAIYKDERILSTDLKKAAGFGKGGEKNYPGVITGLQMQTYLVISDFKRRVNKQGKEYGMAVSILLPPETIWGYETVTAAYSEQPEKSWRRIFEHVREMYPSADEKDIIRLIGKEPNE